MFRQSPRDTRTGKRFPSATLFRSARFQLDTSSTVLLGVPGSGKSALLSRVASDLRDRGATVFALKSDFLSPEVSTETDLQRDLQLPGAPSDLILRLAALQPVYVFIDQDRKSTRLNSSH